MAHTTYAMPVFENFAHSDDDDHSGEGEDSEGQSMNAIYSGGTARRAATTSTAAQDGSLKRKRPGGKGKRKIAIEYITDKSKRAVTFSKRKAGIFTKARELSTLTGSSLLLLVVSESGVVYTYTSEKFIPMVTQDAGKNMIAACLNGTVNLSERFSSSMPGQSRLSSSRSADAQPKRGGEILLKKAFESGTSSVSAAGGSDDVANLAADSGRGRRNGKTRHTGNNAAGQDQDHDGREASDDLAERSPSPAISALPPLPPLSNYDPPEASTSGRHARRSGLTDASVSSGISHEEDIHRHAATPDDIKITSTEADGLEDGDEDISDDECDRRMRTLRRSLSIERHYERISEEQRPRVVRHSVGSESGFASAGRNHDHDALDHTAAAGTGAGDATDVQSQSTGTSTMSALDLTPDAFRGFGYSFARSAEEWDNVKQRFDIPPSVKDSSVHQSQQQDHLGNSGNRDNRPQGQSRRGQHSSRGARVATMPMPVQMPALQELPP